MTIEYFLNLLENVKQTRRGWQARCPAHADRSPSLTIQDGEEGRILVHCFAGCTPKEICSALHVHVRDLFQDAERTSGELWRARKNFMDGVLNRLADAYELRGDLNEST